VTHSHFIHVASARGAVKRNLKIALELPLVALNKFFPTDFPFSAYGSIAGSSFGDYGGEQIAQQIEIGDPSVRNHVTGVAAGAVDPDNERSIALNNIKVQDMRVPGARS